MEKMLSAVNCIYIITDRKTGKNYIGSTYGKEGIWGRWKEYAKTGGHGNNVTLQNYTIKTIAILIISLGLSLKHYLLALVVMKP